MDKIIFKSSKIKTPIGEMLAIADEHKIYMLEFIDRGNLTEKLDKFKINTKSEIYPGITKPINSIEIELESYFAGKLKKFQTPINPIGTKFQQLVWRELLSIPYAGNKSYLSQAGAIDKPKAFRAVANANGANPISIIVPCHRIINNNGKIGGYGGGIERKIWLLNHEKKFF
ncbi:Methylated-DNA--protein-cysteine methyltransferase [Candidatus Arcanobacter lacustris]|jgi:AraC family transcriptional regulator of adaptative response/methylated-DNA-[protein]-cysteine methyltransferase|uniref:methylated-DNA--[protein]-cysteine S-methyltransferase n=1 Tax=Candidatus Arcanibacter lacustris TaxID=1607817 RepID=A0A0F5MNE1_9RICK|nr:Methylated-DNA--protein-cysteine methyltransferase [Candidatus Arcanobacter lacustris]